MTTDSTFLFHTALDKLIPGVQWHDDHISHTTSAYLQADDHTSAEMVWVWPVHDTGWDLDCLADDCLPMVQRVLDTFQRHVPSGNVGTVKCYMAPRKAADAKSDPGWLEWGVVLLDHVGNTRLFIAHIQRAIGAPVERHT